MADSSIAQFKLKLFGGKPTTTTTTTAAAAFFYFERTDKGLEYNDCTCVLSSPVNSTRIAFFSFSAIRSLSIFVCWINSKMRDNTSASTTMSRHRKFFSFDLEVESNLIFEIEFQSNCNPHIGVILYIEVNQHR